MSMTILTIVIVVGLLLILQHVNEEQSNEKTIANQATLIQNQELLKELIADAKGNEIREQAILDNNTSTNIGISKSNSERLDMLLDHFNITYSR